MRKIKLTKGLCALVDDEDFERLNIYSWHSLKCKNNYSAGRRVLYKEDRKRPYIFMHNMILNPPKHLEVDHINRNPLDNRKNNLRLCTHAENTRNRAIYSNNKSGFKGVFREKRLKNYRAYIGYDGKLINLGSFKSKKDAALAYNDKAKELFGEFACLNKI